MSELLTSRLSSIRGKHVAVAVATGFAMAVAFLLVWTGLAMGLDWQVIRGLPRWSRVCLVIVELAVFGWIMITRIIRPIVRAPDDEDVALMVERHWPDFKSRLIAAVQFGQPEAMSDVMSLATSPALVKAMVRQTEDLADKTPLSSVVDTRLLNKSLLVAAVIALIAVALFRWTSPTSGILLQRAMLIEVALPTKTHLESVAAASRCALGDSFKITATASGYLPSNGKIDITYASGRFEELPMEREANTGAYSILLEAVPESFRYEINIYDAHSDAYSVAALERPAIASIDIQQVYPKYTGLGTVTRQSGDLTLLAGSRLKLKVTSTKPLRDTPIGPGQSNYVLRFIDEKAEQSGGADKTTHGDMVPLIRSPNNPREATAEMDLPFGLNAISVHLLDTDDLESRDTAVYPVEVIPDRPPTIRITVPDRKEELVTAQAQLEVGFLAEDDFMLGKITLRYKVDDGSMESIPLDLPPGLKTLRGHYLWDISKIPVPRDKPTLEGSVVEYWLDVEDTNDLSGPGRSASEHYAARVVTRAEKQAEMMARSAETISGIKAASDDQDSLAQKLGMRINEQPRGTTTGPAKP